VKTSFETFLSTLNVESEIYAIFGRGFPHSFYKVYVRATPKGKWWRVKQDGRPVRYDPHKEAQTYPLKGRLGAFTGPVGYFLLYEHIGSAGLGKLRARIVDICGETNRHLRIVDGPRLVIADHDEDKYPQ